MNNEQQVLIDEAYEHYCKSFENQTPIEEYSFDTDPMTQFMFIDKCKENKYFYEKWSLKIEERELSLEEKWELYLKSGLNIEIDGILLELKHMETPFYPKSLPNKLITVTYHNKTITSYE